MLSLLFSCCPPPACGGGPPACGIGWSGGVPVFGILGAFPPLSVARSPPMPLGFDVPTPPGFVPDGPGLIPPVGFVTDLAPPGFVPDGPVLVPRSSNVLAPVGLIADLAPPGFVPDGPVPIPRSSSVLAPVGFVAPGFFAPALGSAVVDVSFAATTPLPANSPGLVVAAIVGVPWFSEASRALFSLAVRSCWSCEAAAATCCDCGSDRVSAGLAGYASDYRCSIAHERMMRCGIT